MSKLTSVKLRERRETRCAVSKKIELLEWKLYITHPYLGQLAVVLPQSIDETMMERREEKKSVVSLERNREEKSVVTSERRERRIVNQRGGKEE